MKNGELWTLRGPTISCVIRWNWKIHLNLLEVTPILLGCCYPIKYDYYNILNVRNQKDNKDRDERKFSTFGLIVRGAKVWFH